MFSVEFELFFRKEICSEVISIYLFIYLFPENILISEKKKKKFTKNCQNESIWGKIKHNCLPIVWLWVMPGRFLGENWCWYVVDELCPVAPVASPWQHRGRREGLVSFWSETLRRKILWPWAPTLIRSQRRLLGRALMWNTKPSLRGTKVIECKRPDSCGKTRNLKRGSPMSSRTLRKRAALERGEHCPAARV